MKSDTELQRDITAELDWEPSVHAAQIAVEVDDGVVRLAGQVDNYAEKWSAERAAQRVAGVRAVSSELRVRLDSPLQRSDRDIARAVENVLEWTSSLPLGAIHVAVEGGWVTLTGTVDWHYQRQLAADSVRYLLGVVGVNEQIELQPALSVLVVKADIEAALQRTANADAKKISVAVEGADVTLAGTVQHWSEREAATQSAWGSPGVRHVLDRLKLDK